MDLFEQRIVELIERHREEIIAYAKDIELHPEPGFREFRTAKKTAEMFSKLGLEIKEGLALTGVLGTNKDIFEGKDEKKIERSERTEIKTDVSENDRTDLEIKDMCPSVTIIGELDAIGCMSHPLSDKETGVAHACGHQAQLAAMIGAAFALQDSEVRRSLGGNVNFLAVPAEEYIDAKKRKEAAKEGIIFTGSGKSELIRQGVFENTDIALTTHFHMMPVKEDLYLGNAACNGFAAEVVNVKGKAAHAAIAPWDGVNALSITTSAIQMMGLMRETFREEDHIRLHNVIRKAGDVINSVPDEAIVETKVRASSLHMIEKVMEQVNRAYDGAAYAFGGVVEKELLQGYMPVLYREADTVLVESAKDLGVSYREASSFDFNNACTDVGDLTHILPVLNFTFSGFEGKLHGADFRISDEEKAYIMPAKMLALAVYKLLKNDGKEAKKIIEKFQPVFDRNTYEKYVKEQYYE